MARTALVSASAVLAMVFGSLPNLGIAGASPDDNSGHCTFGITPPTVVPVSGVSYVYATLRPGVCTLHVDPYSSTVCLTIEGDDSAGQCAVKSGAEPAELYVAYRQGATYIEKGEGCTGLTLPPYTLCQNFPAARFTL